MKAPTTAGHWSTAPCYNLLRRFYYLRAINIFFGLLIAIACIVADGSANASTLVAGFATTNARPNFGVYKPSETIPITFGATGASGETLTVTTYDIEGAVVAGPTTYSVTSASWSTTVNAYKTKLGYYRVYASLTDGTKISKTYVSGATTPQLFASAVPTGNAPSNVPWSSYAGPLPDNFISYAIVPDPTTRLASIPEAQAFYGMQGGFSGTISTDLFAFLGVRWVLDSQWDWKTLEPTPNARNTFTANPPVAITWGTNGNGSTAWNLYSLPNLTKDGRPYQGTPDVYKSRTFSYNTGALDPTYYSDWQNYATHVAQQWPLVYPSRTLKYYEVTWEPIIPWGYGGADPATGLLDSSETAAQLEADLAIMYQKVHDSMHTADANAKIMGPTVDIDSPNSLGLDYAYLDAGLKNTLDVFSAHPYFENDAGWIANGEYDPETAGVPANIATMKRHLKINYGLNIPMIGTEQGWRTHQLIGTAPSQPTPAPSAFNEINQARRMVRGNLIMLGEGWQMNTAFGFSDYWSDDNMDLNHYWDWGLFYNLDPVASGGFGPTKVMPKPIAASYAAMTYVTEGRKSVTNVNWLGDTIRGYVYESYTNSNDELMALWDFSGATTNVTIKTGVASVTQYDWLGNSSTVATSSGNLTVTLKNGEPVYIKGIASSVWGSAKTPTNIAMCKQPVITSSSVASGDLAVDNDPWSYESEWVSANDTNAKWLQINLGGSYSISEVRFFTGNYSVASGYGSDFNFYNTPLPNYHLQQWNGTAWVDVVYRSTNTKSAVDEVFTPVTTTQFRLLIDATATAFQAQVYEVQVFGTPVSGGNPPVITGEPISQSKNVGEQYSIQVAATGTGTLTYQWYHNGTAMPGQTLSLIYNPSAATTDAGDYYCVVSNTYGFTTSDTVTLTVGGSSGGTVDEEVIGATSGSSTRIDTVVEGTTSTNNLWWQSWNGSAWSGYSNLSTTVSSGPSITNWGASRFDIFYAGTDASLRHRSYTGTWSTEDNLSGVMVGGPAATAWSTSRLDVLVRGTDNGLWWINWNGSAWGFWSELSGSTLGSTPAVTNWGAGRLDAFYAGSDHSLRHRVYSSSAWGTEENLTGILVGGPAAVAWASGRIDVVVRGTDDSLWWQNWNGSGWSGWSSLGGTAMSDPVLSSRGSGLLDVFYKGTNGAMKHRSYSSGVWSAEEDLGGGIH